MKQEINNFFETTIENNKYYNIALLPFDYVNFVKDTNIIEQLKQIHETAEEHREKEKNLLQKRIYNSLYKLNISNDSIKEYFLKAILTDRFKNYLGRSFKYAFQYNQDEDIYVSTFMHLAQLLMADVCYEYVWHLDNKR
jgi:hypothetical protein